MASDSRGNEVIFNRAYLNLCFNNKKLSPLVIANKIKEHNIVECFSFGLQGVIDIEPKCLFLRCKYPWPDFEIELVRKKGGDYEFMLFHNDFLKGVGN
ncbi:hypothetical protein I4540_18470 [Klebsiella michiganensis]|uniref:hypothetical protein n=1 Tax=Klebsiella michiganensis TaxID=1134687 RepID=UPI0013D79546|nr:hypothetical protein [Klebsiella michiganensis]MBG2583922.1 hypothetical protein [Klebsiella michiganensis]MBG2593748.1 hypothetical protein [Klebsiella michiganensis]HAT3610092.1 hypothetical protein [Klebsiella michiganensis]